MQLLYILIALAALVANVLGQRYSWDASKMVQIRASDDFHHDFVDIGVTSMCLLQSSDKSGGLQQGDTRNPPSLESQWFKDSNADVQKWVQFRLSRWGWLSLDAVPAARDFDAQGWKQALQTLNAYDGDWRFSRYEHFDRSDPNPIMKQGYYVDPRLGGDNSELFKTGGSRQTAVHFGKGVVIFQPSRSPEEGAKLAWGRNPTPAELPKFQAAGDFMWYDWMRARRLWRNKVKDLNYCGVQQVSDLATHRLIARYLLARTVLDLEDWPASNSFFDTTTPEGRGLLGTRPARQCVSFLLRHKPYLGNKYITGIRVFRSYNPGLKKTFPEMLLKIEDVPANLMKPDLPDDWVPGNKLQEPDPKADIPFIQPEPAVPAPVVPGPSTPRPLPRAAVDPNARKEANPSVSHHIKREGGGKNSVRTHTFHALKRG